MSSDKVKNLTFVNGNLSYKGFTIEIEHGVGVEYFGEYSWCEFSARNEEGRFCCSETLEDVINIDSILGDLK